MSDSTIVLTIFTLQVVNLIVFMYDTAKWIGRYPYGVWGFLVVNFGLMAVSLFLLGIN